jgi:hypothetical protein
MPMPDEPPLTIARLPERSIPGDHLYGGRVNSMHTVVDREWISAPGWRATAQGHLCPSRQLEY